MFLKKNERTQERNAKPPEVVGTCPRCGLPVLARGAVYSCASNVWDAEQRRPVGCGFTLHKLFMHHVISLEEARLLVANGTTGVIGPFMSAGGKCFTAEIVLEDEGQIALSNVEFLD